MLYDNTEIKIIREIFCTPGLNKRELSRRLEIGIPSVDFALAKLPFIKTTKISNQSLHHLDFSDPSLTPYLCMAEFSRLNIPQRPAILEFLKALKEKPSLAILFGSVARGGQVQDDIDILLVFQVCDPDSIEKAANLVSMKHEQRLNPVYMDFQEFRKSFHDPTKSFFKSLRKDKLLLIGHEYWRQLEDEEA